MEKKDLIPPPPRSGGSAGLVLLAMVAALFVTAFIASFSDDPDPTEQQITVGN